jgi:hypothetical protein
MSFSAIWPTFTIAGLDCKYCALDFGLCYCRYRRTAVSRFLNFRPICLILSGYDYYYEEFDACTFRPLIVAFPTPYSRKIKVIFLLCTGLSEVVSKTDVICSKLSLQWVTHCRMLSSHEELPGEHLSSSEVSWHSIWSKQQFRRRLQSAVRFTQRLLAWHRHFVE